MHLSLVRRSDRRRARELIARGSCCSDQALPSGSEKYTNRPHGKSCTSETSTPRPASSSRAASASATTICSPFSEPGAESTMPRPNAIEHADPGGVSCTKRMSSLTVWSTSATKPTWST